MQLALIVLVWVIAAVTLFVGLCVCSLIMSQSQLVDEQTKSERDRNAEAKK